VTLLELRGLDARYGEEQVLYDVSLAVEEGELITVRGAPGAGKTTLLRAISGTVRTRGDVLLDGEHVVPHSPEHLAREGVLHIPSDRGTFAPLSVLDNLRVGAWVRRGASSRDLVHVFELFPELYDQREVRAGSLPDAGQELLALGRALMGHPRLLLVDEPSATGLERLGDLRERGAAVLVVARGGPARHVLDAGRLVA
jgi:branched-chain amino acid transport system ATP-binding protein